MTQYSLQFVIPVAATDTTGTERQTAALWFLLMDYSRWAEWLPHAEAIELLDEGPIGRGTKFQVNTDHGWALWEVSYWDAGKRVIFQIHTGNRHHACAFETRLSDSQQVELLLQLEFPIIGWRRLADPLIRWVYARRASQFSVCLQSWLQQALR